MRWKVQIHGTNQIASLDYDLKYGGMTVLQKGRLNLTNNAGVLEYHPEKPGAILAEFYFPAATNASRTLGGAIAAPEQIQPSSPRPDDFDAFWQAKIEAVKQVPANPRLEEVSGQTNGTKYWKVTLDNIRGTHIQGQLSRPASGEKLPALLIVQYAGVYPLKKSWATDYAAKGWLVLNIEAHDIPIDQSDDFYAKLKDGALNNYPAIGNDNRDTSYFLRMYLGCYQAAEYLTSRPDWNGKTLVVMGASQGGMQALVAAALDPKITEALACVPAGCDQVGPLLGRTPGWPQWYHQAGGKNKVKVIEAGRYYDVVNMAPRIKCAVLIGTGLLDETCPPTGVLAAYNQLHCPKEMVIMPGSTHQGEGNTQAEFRKRQSMWLAALKLGKAPPIRMNAN